MLNKVRLGRLSTLVADGSSTLGSDVVADIARTSSLHRRSNRRIWNRERRNIFSCRPRRVCRLLFDWGFYLLTSSSQGPTGQATLFFPCMFPCFPSQFKENVRSEPQDFWPSRVSTPMLVRVSIPVQSPQSHGRRFHLQTIQTRWTYAITLRRLPHFIHSTTRPHWLIELLIWHLWEIASFEKSLLVTAVCSSLSHMQFREQLVILFAPGERTTYISNECLTRQRH